MSENTSLHTDCVKFIKLFEEEDKNCLTPIVKDAVNACLDVILETCRGNPEKRETEYKDFFESLQQDIKYEWSTNIAARTPFTHMLKNWGYKEKRGNLNHAIATYYWFHVASIYQFKDAKGEYKEKISPQYAKMIDDFALKKGIPVDKYFAKVVSSKKYKEEPISVSSENNNDSPQIQAEANAVKPSRPKKTLEDSKKLSWLNPLNFYDIPFIGRKKEWGRLDKFVEKDTQFQFWTITGPSGAGKTRLANEWLEKSEKLENWESIKLKQNDSTNWKDWKPTSDTIILIDYMLGFANIIREIIDNCTDNTPSYKVRLLVLNHFVPTELGEWIKDLGINFKGIGGSRFEELHSEIFFETDPLDLKKPEDEDQKQIIHEILVHVSGIKSNDPKIKEAEDYLCSMEDAWYPLFAALTGHALRGKEDYSAWSRIDLILHYLSEERTPWEQEGESGQWASAYIAAATALNGQSYDELYKCLPDGIKTHKNVKDIWKEIKYTCKQIVTSDDESKLPPFSPPILGETFFLLFIQALEEVYFATLKKHFIQMLCTGDDKQQIENAIIFVDFIDKLTRNLSMESEKSETVQGFWTCLIDFLNPENFSASPKMQWAVSIALVKILEIENHPLSEKQCKQIIEQVDENCFYRENKDPFLRDSAFYAIRSFEHMKNINTKEIPVSEKILEILAVYEDSRKETTQHTALIMAAFGGSCPIVQALLKHDPKTINKTDNDEMTALMYAAVHGHLPVVKYLAEKDPETISLPNNRGTTALIWAAYNGHLPVVEYIVEKFPETISLPNNSGTTSLMGAAYNGHLPVVEYIVEKFPDTINKTNKYGRTALMRAAHNGHLPVVEYLIEKFPDTINKTNKYGTTALMEAAYNGHLPVVEYLIEKFPDTINKTNKYGTTALMEAAYNGHLSVVKYLAEKDPETINQPDNYGRTALTSACGMGHNDIVKMLIEKGANVNRQNKCGKTALTFAREAGHEDIVQLLLDAEAEDSTEDKKE